MEPLGWIESEDSDEGTPQGGAIWGSGTLTHCTLTSNSSGGNGGAIDGGVTLRHCTVAGNFAGGSGGGVSVGWWVPLGNSIVAGNTLTGDGVNASTGLVPGPLLLPLLVLENSIVAGNSLTGAGSGSDIFNHTNVNASGANLVQTAIFNSSVFAIVNGSDTITVANPLLAPLGDYGGPTQTMALLPGSPARDIATVLVPAITSDQRGFPIVGTPDIGAYEAGTFTSFNAWAWETIPSTNPAHHSPGYDYDGDGRSLLLEFAGQFSPTTPEGGEVMPFTRDAAGTLATLVMPYRPSVPGLIYTIERSTTLGAWTTVVTVNSGTNVAGGVLGGIALTGNTSTTLTFTDTFITGQPRVFYRLRVTHP